MSEKNTQESQEQSQEKPKNIVHTFGQAIGVLVQAADIGRKRGIFDWDDLDAIAQSMRIINKSLEIKESPNTDTSEETSEELSEETSEETPEKNIATEQ